jgi:hypothetical protein
MNTLLVSVSDLSTIESMGLYVLLCVLLYGGYQYPDIAPGGRSSALVDSLPDPSSLQHTCGSNYIQCPDCGAENNSAYPYCANCAGRVWRR